MTPRQRVQAALNHTQPDYTPCDYYATPEIHEALLRHFGLGEPRRIAGTMGGSASALEDGGVAERLGTDIRYVNPPYIGPPLASFPDGSSTNLWASVAGPCRTSTASMPNRSARPTPVDHRRRGRRVRLAQPRLVRLFRPSGPVCQIPRLGHRCGRHVRSDFINGVAFGRASSKCFSTSPWPIPSTCTSLSAGTASTWPTSSASWRPRPDASTWSSAATISASQRGLSISPASFDRFFAAKKKELFDLIHAYGAKVSHHCCGSSRALFPRFIQCGMDALQTVQPQAAGMNPYELKAEFAGRITLHGAVDVQGWLQRSTPKEIEAEVNHLMDEVGRGGGYILAPSHHIQPDTPWKTCWPSTNREATKWNAPVKGRKGIGGGRG